MEIQSEKKNTNRYTKYNKTKRNETKQQKATPPIRIGRVRLNLRIYIHKTGHGIILHCINWTMDTRVVCGMVKCLHIHTGTEIGTIATWHFKLAFWCALREQ